MSRTTCANCEGWGCTRCASTRTPRPGDLSSWRAEAEVRREKAAAAIKLVEALFDADDSDETSPFCVVVLPESVRVELERCRVAFKRHRRGG